MKTLRDELKTRKNLNGRVTFTEDEGEMIVRYNAADHETIVDILWQLHIRRIAMGDMS